VKTGSVAEVVVEMDMKVGDSISVVDWSVVESTLPEDGVTGKVKLPGLEGRAVSGNDVTVTVET
jgi:hypothetical protein